MKLINTILILGVLAANAYKIDDTCPAEKDRIIRALNGCVQYATLAAQAARDGRKIAKWFKEDSEHVRNHVAGTLDRIAKECATSDAGISILSCVDGPETNNGCVVNAAYPGFCAYTEYTIDKTVYCPQYFRHPEFTEWPGNCLVDNQASISLHEAAHLNLGE